MKKTSFFNSSFGIGIKFLSGLIVSVAFLFTLVLTCCKNKPVVKTEPENKVETIKISQVTQQIIANIKQNPKDWSTKEVEQKHVIDSDIIEYWTNKKCDIKIKVGYSYLGTYVKLISPDTLDIRESEVDTLARTYYKYVRDPQQLIKDSIDRIELHKKIIRDNQIYSKKEAEILNKLCK